MVGGAVQWQLRKLRRAEHLHNSTRALNTQTKLTLLIGQIHEGYKSSLELTKRHSRSLAVFRIQVLILLIILLLISGRS
jgi:hypothetical protein